MSMDKIAEIVCRLLPKYRKIECCDCDYKQWCVPEQQAILALIEQETAKLHAIIKDDCDTEDDCRESAKKVLTEYEVEGDSYGVPAISDIVDKLVAKVQEQRGNENN